ncbi:hypothetical protein B8W76_03490 [Pseudomonas aeruginosa]|uniref:hypothetical protein n=1 Tax=Pseudomonas aeruginosa TaxID=287 RepID=UPI000689D519|nr:hypothetical protein [Pseudomonas aeruginosa]KSK23431.1 hypothetical protein APA27_18020 [Pseudomonas aeruginosa]OUM38508.1 hypothetical protein B8W76_03490 [Pseudomonas aeruginosa]RUD27785.1 hypothetical protein IPC1375_08140 [Pseudomonas aeruginosa]TEG38761.1 hypothetical protein IPC1342_05725 [Pseudomonas aeruginosa]HBP1670503.1 hypothetical protein [Pseudomonas aeruginosa]
MSKVKRLNFTVSKFESVVPYASEHGQYVRYADYAKLEAEAQALREQNTKFQHMLADITVKHFSDNIKRSTAQKSMDVYLSDGIRLLEEERDRIERNRDMWKGQCERQAEQLAALRARVVVVPEPLNEGDARRECGEYGAAMQRGYNACLRKLARLNGLTVSESALDTLRRFATGKVMHLNNGLCPDDIDGHEARDPDCPVCRALIETGKESDNV